jgi:hypothetical protein
MDLITFNCSACQQVLKVGAENAGKQAKCPRCGTALVIPSASAGGSKTNPRPAPPPPPARKYREEEPFEDIPPAPPARPARARPVDEDDEEERRPRPRRRDDDGDEDRPARARRRDDDYDEDRPARARRRGEDDDDDRRDRPRRRAERYEEDEEEYDRPRRGGMSPRKKWGFVRLGVLLVAIAACALAGGAGLDTIASVISFIMDLSDKPSEGTAFKIIARIGQGLISAGGLVALVGYVFCIFVPNKNGTLVYAIIALALGVINFVMNLLCRIIPMFQILGFFALIMPGFGLVKESLGGAFAVTIFVVLLFFGEFIVYSLFMWAACRAVKARWATRNWIGVVVFAGVAAGIQLLSYIMIFVALNSQRSGGGGKGLLITVDIIRVIASLAFVGFAAWYAVQLFRTKDLLEPNSSSQERY